MLLSLVFTGDFIFLYGCLKIHILCHSLLSYAILHFNIKLHFHLMLHLLLFCGRCYTVCEMCREFTI